MSYRIDQDFEYAGKDYWHWRAWIVGDTAEMAAVQKVVWILHPSFKRTRVEISKPADGFRLAASGWGTFRLRAEVVLKHGQVQALSRNLKLEYPDRQGDEGQGDPTTSNAVEEVIPAATASSSAHISGAGGMGSTVVFGKPKITAAETRQRSTGRSVFLSYSGEDSRAASRLRGQLEGAGVMVLDASLIESGQSWSEALRQMLARADSVVALVTEGEASPFVVDELQAALAAEKPTLALVPMGNGSGNGSGGGGQEGRSALGLPPGVAWIEFDPGRSDPAPLLNLIHSQTGG